MRSGAVLVLTRIDFKHIDEYAEVFSLILIKKFKPLSNYL